MLSRDEVYRAPSGTAADPEHTERVAKRYVQKLKKMGYTVEISAAA